jgi:hypothetical protein
MTMKLISGVKGSTQVKVDHFSCHNGSLCDLNVNVMLNLYFICNFLFNKFLIFNLNLHTI